MAATNNSALTFIVNNLDGSSCGWTSNSTPISVNATVSKNDSDIKDHFLSQEGISSIETEICTPTGGVEDILITEINGVCNTSERCWKIFYNGCSVDMGLNSLLKTIKAGEISFRYVRH